MSVATIYDAKLHLTKVIILHLRVINHMINCDTFPHLSEQ